MAGTPTALYVGRLNALALQMREDVEVTIGPNTVILRPIIYSPNGQTFIDITGSRSRAVWATQRRRSYLRNGDQDLFT